MGPERKIEALLGRLAKECGGISIKLVPTVAGLPDRLVLLPGGGFHLVELKSPVGRLRPIQVVTHERLAEMGHPVVVLNSETSVREWFNDVMGGRT